MEGRISDIISKMDLIEWVLLFLIWGCGHQELLILCKDFLGKTRDNVIDLVEYFWRNVQ